MKIKTREDKLRDLINLYIKLVAAERHCAGSNLALSTLQNNYAETVFKICGQRELWGKEIHDLNEKIEKLEKKLEIK